MTRLLCIVSALFLCVLLVGEQAAWGAGELWISCEGYRSNGGGARAYQYTLKNTGPAPVTLTLFYLGTMDSTPGNYSAWTAPAGFNATGTVADWNTLFNLYQTSMMSTTMIKTPHGMLPPPMAYPTYAGIAWSGSTIINSGQTVTFGFNNPHEPWDMEWFAEHPDAAQSSMGFLYLPIAGPVGTFTQGFVHGPSEASVPTEGATFGKIKALYSSGE
jgi:hypothetical protein